MVARSLRALSDVRRRRNLVGIGLEVTGLGWPGDCTVLPDPTRIGGDSRTVACVRLAPTPVARRLLTLAEGKGVSMIRIIVLGVVVVALSWANVPAYGTLCMPPTVQKDSPYHYIASLTEALTYGQSGLDRTVRSGQKSSVIGFDLLLGLKVGKKDFDCAASQVSPYADSSSEAIRASAEGATLVFTLLSELHERSIGEYRAILDMRDGGRLGTVTERLAELGAAYDETWKLLIPAGILGTYAIVRESPTTGRMSGLALTRVQRDELLRRLRATFGEAVTNGPKAGQHALTATAAVLYLVVGDPQRQLVESK
jgi:hypothetical protein